MIKYKSQKTERAWLENSQVVIYVNAWLAYENYSSL